MYLIQITMDQMNLETVGDEDTGRLVEMLAERGCVHVVANEDLDLALDAGLEARDHGWKNAARGLGKYLLGYGEEPQAIRTQYASAKRLPDQGVRPLIKETRRQEYVSPFLIGVPENTLLKLAKSATGGDALADGKIGSDRTSREALFLSLLPNVPVPDGVDLEAQFRGTSPEARLVKRLIAIAGPKKAPVLVQGPTGTGKEIVARAIHACSGRGGSFIPVNCGAIPETLFESELFGYEPGVFTDGLKDGKIGLWEKADEGTLFLDEIAELPLYCQTKVLRALEERAVRRVGGHEERPVDARVIAATCRDLFRCVEQGRFREDLFYRLRRFLIRTPPLDTEPRQLAEVIQDLWKDMVGGEKEELGPTVLRLLAGRRWVGNYRDLKNFLGMLNDHFDVQRIQPRHVRLLMAHYGPSPSPGVSAQGALLSDAISGIEQRQHQNLVAEVVRGVQVDVAPLIKTRGAVAPDLHEVLTRRLTELGLLLRKLERFRNRKTQSAVEDAHALLTDLVALLPEEEPKARSFCKRKLRPALDKALELLFPDPA